MTSNIFNIFNRAMSPTNAARYRVVFVRHGESTYNQLNRFTGWQDVALTQKGIEEARHAGTILKEHNFEFDLAYSSMLKRALWTYHAIADELDIHSVELRKDWRLNEKHYGALQGLQKDVEHSKHLNQKQLKEWRETFVGAGPGLCKTDFRHPIHDRKYYGIVHPDALPKVESMKDCMNRTLPFWQNQVLRNINKDKQILIVSHKNTLRALFTHIQGLEYEECKKMIVPNGVPIVYEFNQNLEYLRNYTLEQSTCQADHQSMFDDEQSLEARDELTSSQSSDEVELPQIVFSEQQKSSAALQLLRNQMKASDQKLESNSFYRELQQQQKSYYDELYKGI